jgi:hypothetical protein
MNTQKYNDILNWIKTHRFWTSVIILWGLHLILSAIPLNLLDMGGILEFVLSSQFLGYYTLIGGIIWSFQQKKTGYSLITLGIVSLLFAFNTLIKFYVYYIAGLHPYYLPPDYIMLSIGLICGAAFIFWGNQRYRQQALCRNENGKR